jgi:hypothetical protein
VILRHEEAKADLIRGGAVRLQRKGPVEPPRGGLEAMLLSHTYDPSRPQWTCSFEVRIPSRSKTSGTASKAGLKPAGHQRFDRGVISSSKTGIMSATSAITQLAFYNCRAEHAVHLVTNNPLESSFSTVRLTTSVILVRHAKRR